MYSFIHVVFLALLPLIVRTGTIMDITVNDYLNKKLSEATLQIVKNHIQQSKPVPVNTFSVYWKKLRTEPLDKNPILNINILSDKIFILNRNEIKEVVGESPFNNTLLSREMTSQEYSPKFIRSTAIVWKAVLYFLVCYDTGRCSLYTGTDNVKLMLRQNIRYKGFLTDAIFFTKTNQLYMIIVVNMGQFSVPSTIYRWTGTYMDAIEKVTTTAAVSVTTFNYKKSTIIIFLEDSNNKENFGSNVYDFKQNHIRKIQCIPTNKPLSIHHYSHAGYDFILINQAKVSMVFLWNGRQFLNYMGHPEIGTSNLIQIFNMKDDTYYLLAQQNVLQLFKMNNINDYTSLSIKKLDDEQKIVDMQVRLNDEELIVVLIIKKASNIFCIETWLLNIKKILHESSQAIVADPMKCLSNLLGQLRTRMSIIPILSSISFLHFSNSSVIDLTNLNEIPLTNVILESVTVGNIYLHTKEDPSTAISDFRRDFEDLYHNLSPLFSLPWNTTQINKNIAFIGDVVVDNEALFNDLYIDSIHIDVLNEIDVRLHDVLCLGRNQRFTTNLRARSIFVYNAEVDSFCGIPSQYWAVKNDTTKISIKNNINNILNDTIYVYSNMSIPDLNIQEMNGIKVRNLITQLYIRDLNQTIKATIKYKRRLEVSNLEIQNLNEIQLDKFITRKTNQTLNNLFISELKIGNLFAEFVNDFQMKEVAKLSQKNVIKGEVRIQNLEVIKSLVFYTDARIMRLGTTQIYDNITILGNVTLKNINFEVNTNFVIDDSQINLNTTLATLWTKYTDQTIEASISFNAGITIDALHTKYLNGFLEDEFLYITGEEVFNTFTNLYFKNFLVTDLFLVEDRKVDIYNITQDILKFNVNFHLRHLQINNLVADFYNGIPVHLIVKGGKFLNFSRNIEFFDVHSHNVTVDDLFLDYLNERKISVHMDKVLYVHTNVEVKSIVVPKFIVRKLLVEQFNGIDTRHLTKWNDVNVTNIRHIIINGDVIINENLKALQIDNYLTEDYTNKVAQRYTKKITNETFHKLIVRENVMTHLLNGYEVHTLLTNILSKEKPQKIPGHFSFYKISAVEVAAKVINRKNASDLIWIDEPLTLIGNVTFTNLSVERDIIIKNFNGYNVEMLHRGLLSVPPKKINLLKVDKNVTWKLPTIRPNFLSYIVQMAFRKDTDQIILSDVYFARDVIISTFTGSIKEINAIREIILDTVLDNDKTNISIGGCKTFLTDLKVDVLIVQNDIHVSRYNNVDVLRFNDSVVYKYEDCTVTGSIAFLNEVTMNKLLTNMTIYGSSVNKAAYSTDILPNNILFEHLFVLENIQTKNIDSINLEEFMSNRITLDGDHDIYFDVQLKGYVKTVGNAVVDNINDIPTSNMISIRNNISQVISGEKTFTNDLLVDGNVETNFVNNIYINTFFKDGVLNGQDVHMFGNVIFEAELQLYNNVTISGLINNAYRDNIVKDMEMSLNRKFNILKQAKISVQDKIYNEKNVTQLLPNIFCYFEMEQNSIKTRNVKKIVTTNMGSVTKLKAYDEQLGMLCESSTESPCPFRYIIEIPENDCCIKIKNDSPVIQSFHNLNNTFGVEVKDAVSNGSKYSPKKTDLKFITITWMTDQIVDRIHRNITHPSIKIKGLLKDIQIFVHKSEVYIVMVQHNTLNTTHYMDTLIYKLDLEKKNLTLHQTIPVDIVWAIDVSSYQGVTYLVIGSMGRERKFLLYKLDPITTMFTLRKTIISRSNLVNILPQGRNCFVLTDNPEIHAVNIFHYDSNSDNFYSYQSLFFESHVNGIQKFYTSEFDHEDMFLGVTTEEGLLFIYEYTFIGKFQRKTVLHQNDVQAAHSFFHTRHFLVSKNTNSTVLS